MDIYTAPCLRGFAGSWSSGYDIALTQRRSPVRIRSSPSNLRGNTNSTLGDTPLREGCTMPTPLVLVWESPAGA